MPPLATYAELAAPPATGWPRSVLGLLLNDRKGLAALGDAVHAAPYKAPPRAPVLYVKPANTYARDGAPVALDADVPEVVVGACLAVEFARPVRGATLANALDGVAGLRVVADLYAPHDSYYRPPIKQKCRDGFCPIGSRLAGLADVGDPDALAIAVRIDGTAALQASTAGQVRSLAQAIVDVSAFMTLDRGDLLLLGVPHGAPRARAGQRVEIEIERVGALAFPLVHAQEARA
ncbi:2-hydroxyhepta-2,4-diene-1,7-dioate isomerase [Verticiella sediminum]|uniref:2-hydroxyhepta-2,4-diene-1,7-dioate isomerase n=1 Tax=Verticiella sediminum TaxID=1247510 RepID=A0A556AZQ2_9BURK|nr:fumarylacetoacetate hydrolase family protein [Verticiella sediminum]TSH98396.1 2-hydroxyhepta-2,4-diene-1,7-dioate isomerase [Verticiella sediminum]